MAKKSPLTSLLKSVSSREPDEARLVRQQELLNKISASENQYQYLITRYSPEKLEKIIKQLDNFKYGLNAAAPVICMGPNKCAFFHACPIGNGYAKDSKTGTRIPVYDDIEDFPIGDQCIVEKVYIEQKLIDYIQEFDVDPARPSELSLINDLALVDLYKNRAILIMAAGDRDGEGQDFMKADTTYMTGQSELETKAYKEHPLFSVVDKLEKRRHRILEELLATRRTKAAAAARFGTGIGASQLVTEIEKLRKAIEMKKTISKMNENDETQELLESEEIIELE